MKRSSKIAVTVVATLGLGAAVTVFAHPGGMGPGTMMQGMQHQGMQHDGPMAGMHSGDAAFQADMQLVHEMLAGHDKIKRSVENLPDGIRTVTESDDPQVAQALKAHVASMEQRLKDGRIFNLFSSTLPVLFDNRDKIKTTVETTPKGSIVTQTSARRQGGRRAPGARRRGRRAGARRNGRHDARHALAHDGSLEMKRALLLALSLSLVGPWRWPSRLTRTSTASAAQSNGRTCSTIRSAMHGRSPTKSSRRWPSSPMPSLPTSARAPATSAVRLANMVPKGRVYGVDIEPDMVKYLAERAKREKRDNVVAIAGAPADPRLPEKVDLILHGRRVPPH